MTLDQANISRELGQHETRLGHIEKKVEGMDEKLDNLLVIATKAQMGFAILGSVATAGGLVGAAIPAILRAMGGAAMIAALLCMASCSGTADRQATTTFEVAAVSTPVGPVGPFHGKIVEESHEQTSTGPDFDQLQRGTNLLGGLVSNIPGPLGAIGLLGLTAASGFLALKNRKLDTAIGQTVRGLQDAKRDLPADHIERIHIALGTAQDEATKKIIKDYK